MESITGAIVKGATESLVEEGIKALYYKCKVKGHDVDELFVIDVSLSEWERFDTGLPKFERIIKEFEADHNMLKSQTSKIAFRYELIPKFEWDYPPFEGLDISERQLKQMEDQEELELELALSTYISGIKLYLNPEKGEFNESIEDFYYLLKDLEVKFQNTELLNVKSIIGFIILETDSDFAIKIYRKIKEKLERRKIMYVIPRISKIENKERIVLPLKDWLIVEILKGSMPRRFL